MLKMPQMFSNGEQKARQRIIHGEYYQQEMVIITFILSLAIK